MTYLSDPASGGAALFRLPQLEKGTHPVEGHLQVLGPWQAEVSFVAPGGNPLTGYHSAILRLVSGGVVSASVTNSPADGGLPVIEVALPPGVRVCVGLASTVRDGALKLFAIPHWTGAVGDAESEALAQSGAIRPLRPAGF